MEVLLKLLPVLLSRGGDVAEIAQLITRLMTLVAGLVPQQQPQIPDRLDVRWLQETLGRLGFAPGTADGVYGQRTRDAVMRYQQARGLVADGWAGIATQTKLLSERIDT